MCLISSNASLKSSRIAAFGAIALAREHVRSPRVTGFLVRMKLVGNWSSPVGRNL